MIVIKVFWFSLHYNNKFSLEIFNDVQFILPNEWNFLLVLPQKNTCTLSLGSKYTNQIGIDLSSCTRNWGLATVDRVKQDKKYEVSGVRKRKMYGKNVFNFKTS